MATKKKSLKQRLADQKKDLASKGKGGYILRQKDEGTLRLRILPTGEDNDFCSEIISFFLGTDKELGEVLSPSTFGEPCALMEAYTELKNSGDDDDLEIAKKMVPKQKYVIPVIMYKDLKGTQVDTENSNRLFQIAPSVYNQIIDLYLDEDEWGDMTDPKNGYDLKITRTGKGKFDTSYTVSACKNTPLPKEYQKTVVNLEEMVKAKIASYEETVEKKLRFLGSSDDDDDEDDAPKSRKERLRDKKSKSTSDKKSTTKKRRRDI